MRILATADTHGHMPIFARYAALLRDGPYDAGIIVGDILDDGFKPEEFQDAIAGTGLSEDDFAPELAGADEEFSRYADRQIKALYHADSPFMQTMANIERKARAILSESGKPIYCVPGNHDLTSWSSDGSIINIDGTRVSIGRFNLVGYRWTTLDRRERQQRKDLRTLRRKIDQSTILVTHSPPHGMLDDVYLDGRGTVHYGSRAIRSAIDRTPPRLHLFGHVHQRFGREGNLINCSFPTRRAFVAVDLDSGRSEEVESGIEEGFWQ